MNFFRCKCKGQYQLLCTLYRNDMKRKHYVRMIIYRFCIRLKEHDERKLAWPKGEEMEHITRILSEILAINVVKKMFLFV